MTIGSLLNISSLISLLIELNLLILIALITHTSSLTNLQIESTIN
jgi:hypothetical protein